MAASDSITPAAVLPETFHVSWGMPKDICVAIVLDSTKEVGEYWIRIKPSEESSALGTVFYFDDKRELFLIRATIREEASFLNVPEEEWEERFEQSKHDMIEEYLSIRQRFEFTIGDAVQPSEPRNLYFAQWSVNDSLLVLELTQSDISDPLTLRLTSKFTNGPSIAVD